MAEQTVRELADELIEAIEERICGHLTPREKQRLRPDLEWPIRRIDAELLDRKQDE